MSQTEETGEILTAMQLGDRSGVGRLMEIVYGELRDLAGRYLANEDPHHTLQPTALVHEAYLKLVSQRQAEWQGRSHFRAIGAQAMRRILVDHARTKSRRKRGGDFRRVPLDVGLSISTNRAEDVIALDEALQKLTDLDADQAQIVEYRFFGGMTMAEIAEAMGTSKRSVERQWTMIRAWLNRELADEEPDS
jgi:RNA polymerase sigma factor (TIGR02999 family)